MSLINQKKQTNNYLKYGIVEFTPLLVNPTRNELNSFLNISGENEIQYIYEENGIKTARIDIWGETSLGRKECIAYYITNDVVKSKEGRICYINGQGISNWSSPDDIRNNDAINKWYHVDSMRPMLKGEDTLINFFIKLLNIYTKWDAAIGETPNTFLNTEAIFNGDFTELQQAANQKKSVFVYQGIIMKAVNGVEKHLTFLYNNLVLNPKQAINKESCLKILENPYSGFKRNVTDWNISKELITFNNTPVINDKLPF